MATKMTPPFGVVGLWRLKSPFVAKPAKQYVCAAIRSYAELRLVNFDVYDICYRPHELEESVYESDAAINASLVVLIGTDGERIYVPDTYIESYPDLNIGNFRRFILSCEVGVLPANTSLDHVTEAIKSVVSDKIGRTVSVDTYIGEITPESLNPAELRREESNRQAGIRDTTTIHGKLYLANKQIGDLQGYVKILEQKVKEKDGTAYELSQLKLAHDALTSEHDTLKQQHQTLTELQARTNSDLDNQKQRNKVLEKTILQLGGKVPD